MFSSNHVSSQQSSGSKRTITATSASPSTVIATAFATPLVSPLFGLGLWPSLVSPLEDHCVPFDGEGRIIPEDLTGLGISYRNSPPSFLPASPWSSIPSRHKHRLSWSRSSCIYIEREGANEPCHSNIDSDRRVLHCHSRTASVTKAEIRLQHNASSSAKDLQFSHGSSRSIQTKQLFDVKEEIEEHITGLSKFPLCLVEHTEACFRSPSLTAYRQSFSLKCSLSPQDPWDAVEMPLPVVDINMRQVSMSRQSQSLGINPANLTLSSLQASSVDSGSAPAVKHHQSPSPTSVGFDMHALITVDDTMKNDCVCVENTVFPNSGTPDICTSVPLPSPAKAELCLPRRKRNRINHREESSDYKGHESHSTILSHGFVPCDHIVRKERSLLCLLEELEGGTLQAKSTLPVLIEIGTPVLNAHGGISLQDLQSKADRYRLRNPGREYVKEWLLSFTGKLASSGRPLAKYRCYVAGCNQTNKRRDHMLIHIGGHLNQRPFQCSYCPSRFLRKNECNRHELGHTGMRPYVCHLCLFDRATFVRNDLLLRHMKRKHKDEAEVVKRNPRLVKKARTM